MIGKQILHYKIIEKLGEGGMGVVYLAEDTKLDRKVAVKFLPPNIAQDGDERNRFEIEAKAASALNHANVCTIHDIMDHDGRIFIVMEYVDGQLLREMINSRQVTIKMAVDICSQIAEGLAAAHAKGIVHRDIKPENIIVRKDGIAQILDFGLAKYRGISKLTKEGSTLGTAGYMSPEQVQGREADHRSDIFSLGVLLYELLTGQLPFQGVHEAALSYEIINVDPQPPSALKAAIEPEIDRIVLDCMEKDPNERTQSVKQVAIDLRRAIRDSGRQRISRMSGVRSAGVPGGTHIDNINSGNDRPANAKRSLNQWLVTFSAVLFALVLGFSLARIFTPDPEPAPVVKATMYLPPEIKYTDAIGGHSSISPDGTKIVFAGSDSTHKSLLWLRPMDSDEVKPISGTANANYPFWSPDGRSVGFFVEGKLKTVDIEKGMILTLADAPYGRGGAWSSSGEILFSPSVTEHNLFSVPVSGGIPRIVTDIDTSSQKVPRFPFFLPDGRHFLYSLINLDNANSPDADIYLGSLDSPESRLILSAGTYAQYASGFLLFYRQNILLARSFDPQSYVLQEKTGPLQASLNSWPPRAKVDYSVSQNGILMYSGSQIKQSGKLIWISSDGGTRTIIEDGAYRMAALSPDGTKVAYDQFDSQLNISIISIYNLLSKSSMRLTVSTWGGSQPVWSHDSKKVYYNVDLSGDKSVVMVKNADGSGAEELISRGEAGDVAESIPMDVTHDGRFLLLRTGAGMHGELAVVDLSKSERPLPLVKLGIKGRRARFSPDARWLIYESLETGAQQLFVQEFQGGGGKWLLTSNGGSEPFWHGNRIVYYSSSLTRYEYIDVRMVSRTPVFSPAKPLFPEGKLQDTYIYNATADGKEYFGYKPDNAESSGNLSLIVNWPELLK